MVVWPKVRFIDYVSVFQPNTLLPSQSSQLDSESGTCLHLNILMLGFVSGRGSAVISTTPLPTEIATGTGRGEKTSRTQVEKESKGGKVTMKNNHRTLRKSQHCLLYWKSKFVLHPTPPLFELGHRYRPTNAANINQPNSLLVVILCTR